MNNINVLSRLGCMGFRLLLFRKAIGKSPSQLVSESGVPLPELAAVEAGTAAPEINYLHFLGSRYGLNINWIGPKEIVEIVPGIRTKDLRGGTYSPDDGNLSPLRSSNAFFFASQREGVQFRFREKVTGIGVEGGKVTSVVTDRDLYSCGHVLNAAGSNANEIGKLVGIDLPVFPD